MRFMFNREATEGAVVRFLTWVWLSVVVLLCGAEINCEIERSSHRRDKACNARHDRWAPALHFRVEPRAFYIATRNLH
jgi:hypothetical protein